MYGYEEDPYEVEYVETPIQETVYMVNGEPGRTIIKASNKVPKPFVVKNSIRSSINLWEDLESLCLNGHEDVNLPTYADINSAEPNIEERQGGVLLEINEGFNVGTHDGTPSSADNKLSGNIPKKITHRNTKQLEPILPNAKLRKTLSFVPPTTPPKPINETQRLAKKTLQKELRNNNETIDTSLPSRQRNESTSNESEEEGEIEPSLKRNIAQSSKVSWNAKPKPKQQQHKSVHCSAKNISYLEAQQNIENGEEERDFGGGPSGITVGGLKEESFEFFSYKKAASSDKREWHKDDDISARKTHIVRKKPLIHPTEFGREDLLHLNTHTEEVLAKFDVNYKLSPLMFKLRGALVLVQGCRYGIMKVLEFFFDNYSYIFKVNDIFTYNYLCDISNTPHYWFMSINQLKPSKQTLPVGQTLLHIAASNHHVDMVKYLVEVKGANIEIEDCCGYTPLMVSTSNLELVKYFVLKKCNVNHQNRYGVTPLMISTLNGYCKGVTECLVEAGADLLLADTSGRSAIHYLISAFQIDELEKFMKPEFFPTSRMGCLSYAGLPLFLHLPKYHEIQLLLETSLVSASQKVSLKLIEYLAKTNAQTPRTLANAEKYEGYLRKAISYREKMGIEFEELPLIEAYGNRREAKTEAELDHILSNFPSADSSRMIEMLYQALLISDRICGVNSYSSLSLHIAIFHEVFYIYYEDKNHHRSIPRPINKELAAHSLKLIVRFAECAPWFATAAGPTKEVHTLFDYFITRYEEILNTFKYHNPPTEPIGRILNNFSDAIIIFSRNTSYTHIHHSTFSEIDRSILTRWVGVLIRKGRYYDWFRPMRRHFYAQLDFSYTIGCHVSNLAVSFTSIGGSSAEDLKEYLEVAGHQWLSRPGYGSFAVQKATQKHVHILTSYYIEYGFHPDVVTCECEYPLHAVRPNPYLFRKIRSQLRPRPLVCICADFIATEMKYEDMFMPQRIKEFISIHDIYGHHALYRKHFGYP